PDPPPEQDPDPVELVPERSRWRPAWRLRWRPRWRLLGALLCFASAILTLLGSFGTLFTATVEFSERSRSVLTITGWDIRVSTDAALASIVFAWLPARARLDRVEPDTSPIGVPVVVVHRLPDAEADDPQANA